MTLITLVRGSRADVEELVRERRGERIVVVGWPSAAERRFAGQLRVGVVAGAEDAAGVVLAAMAGADVVARIDVDQPLVDRLCDDARRVATIEIVDGHPRTVPSDDVTALDDEDRAILAALADGRTRGTIAADLHLSSRTLDRRLARIKAHLGAQTIAQAVDAARDDAVRPVPGSPRRGR